MQTIRNLVGNKQNFTVDVPSVVPPCRAIIFVDFPTAQFEVDQPVYVDIYPVDYVTEGKTEATLKADRLEHIEWNTTEEDWEGVSQYIIKTDVDDLCLILTMTDNYTVVASYLDGYKQLVYPIISYYKGYTVRDMKIQYMDDFGINKIFKLNNLNNKVYLTSKYNANRLRQLYNEYYISWSGNLIDILNTGELPTSFNMNKYNCKFGNTENINNVTPYYFPYKPLYHRSFVYVGEHSDGDLIKKIYFSFRNPSTYSTTLASMTVGYNSADKAIVATQIPSKSVATGITKSSDKFTVYNMNTDVEYAINTLKGTYVDASIKPRAIDGISRYQTIIYKTDPNRPQPAILTWMDFDVRTAPCGEKIRRIVYRNDIGGKQVLEFCNDPDNGVTITKTTGWNDSKTYKNEDNDTVTYYKNVVSEWEVEMILENKYLDMAKGFVNGNILDTNGMSVTDAQISGQSKKFFKLTFKFTENPNNYE